MDLSITNSQIASFMQDPNENLEIKSKTSARNSKEISFENSIIFKKLKKNDGHSLRVSLMSQHSQISKNGMDDRISYPSQNFRLEKSPYNIEDKISEKCESECLSKENFNTFKNKIQRRDMEEKCCNQCNIF